jgi:stage V sporulation protein G
MNIKVEIKKIFKGDRPTKAYANVVIDEGFVIHGVGICENEKGRYITMPQTSWMKQNEEVKKPVCHPITSSVRKQMEEALFNAYDEKIAENN